MVLSGIFHIVCSMLELPRKIAGALFFFIQLIILLQKTLLFRLGSSFLICFLIQIDLSPYTYHNQNGNLSIPYSIGLTFFSVIISF